MSTVRITSAGEFSPSAAMRSSRPLSRNSTWVLMPVFVGEGIEQRLDQFGLAIGVDVDDGPSAKAGAAMASSATPMVQNARPRQITYILSSRRSGSRPNGSGRHAEYRSDRVRSMKSRFASIV